MKNFAHRDERLALRQKGAVLIISLIFLVVLTLIVLSALRGATFQERMAANARNQQQAFEAAEAVLRDAAVTLFVQGGVFDNYKATDFSAFDSTTKGCANGLCQKAGVGVERWRTYNWGSTTLTKTFSIASLNMEKVPTQPRYFIELVDAPRESAVGSGNGCEAGIYNITARAVGRDSAVALVQGTYKFKPQTC